MPDRPAESFVELGKQLREALRRKGHAMTPAISRAFKRDGIRWHSAMTKRLRGPLVLEGPKSPSDRLATRSGALHRSLVNIVRGRDLDELTLIKGSTSHYAVMHELGTVGAGGTLPDIVPVRRKWLAWPTAEAMTPSGVPRRAGPRQWPDLRFVKSKSNPERAFLIEGDGERSRILYILGKRSAIPPRMGMVDTHVKHAPKRQADIKAAIGEALSA